MPRALQLGHGRVRHGERPVAQRGGGGGFDSPRDGEHRSVLSGGFAKKQMAIPGLPGGFFLGA